MRVPKKSKNQKKLYTFWEKVKASEEDIPLWKEALHKTCLKVGQYPLCKVRSIEEDYNNDYPDFVKFASRFIDLPPYNIYISSDNKTIRVLDKYGIPHNDDERENDIYNADEEENEVDDGAVRVSAADVFLPLFVTGSAQKRINNCCYNRFKSSLRHEIKKLSSDRNKDQGRYRKLERSKVFFAISNICYFLPYSKKTKKKHLSPLLAKTLWNEIDNDVARMAMGIRGFKADTLDYNFIAHNYEDVKKLYYTTPGVLPLWLEFERSVFQKSNLDSFEDYCFKRSGVVSTLKYFLEFFGCYSNSLWKMICRLSLYWSRALADRTVARSDLQYIQVVCNYSRINNDVLKQGLQNFFRGYDGRDITMLSHPDPHLSALMFLVELREMPKYTILTRCFLQFYSGSDRPEDEECVLFGRSRQLEKTTAYDNLYSHWEYSYDSQQLELVCNEIKEFEPQVLYQFENHRRNCLLPFWRAAFKESRKRTVKDFIRIVSDSHDWIRNENPIFDKNQSRQGWQWFARKSEEWHNDAIARNYGKKRFLTWGSLIVEPFEYQDHKVVPLTKGEELAVEGQEMRHCVGTYIEDCYEGKVRVFSIQKDKQKVATLAIRYNRDKWKISQCRSKYNKEVNKEIKNVAQMVCDIYNEKEFELNNQENEIKSNKIKETCTELTACEELTRG